MPLAGLLKSNECYNGMFKDCTNLISAPALPATTLANYCYYHMFAGCSKLNFVTMLATDISARGCFEFWLHDVATTGIFVKSPDMTSLSTGENGIPKGWTVVDYDMSEEPEDIPYVTFSADTNQTMTVVLNGNYVLDSSLQYSVGGGEWMQLTASTPISFGGAEGDLRLRGQSTSGMANHASEFAQITFEDNEVEVACNGDIRTLVDYKAYDRVSTVEARFCCLFKN